MRREQIPYGVKDFKRIRVENRYYVDIHLDNALRNLIVGHRAYFGSEADVRGLLEEVK